MSLDELVVQSHCELCLSPVIPHQELFVAYNSSREALRAKRHWLVIFGDH
jgi:hypothetical protein